MKNIAPTEGVSVQLLAERTQGTLVGDRSRYARSVCSAVEPTRDGVSFLRTPSTKGIRHLDEAGVAALFLPTKTEQKLLDGLRCTVILVPHPQQALLKVLPLFVAPHHVSKGVSPRAEVSPTARLGNNVTIGAFSVIGDGVVIEDRVTIHPHVVVYPGASIGSDSVIHSGAIIREDCKVGRNVTIQNGAVVGSDGFGYIPVAGQGLQLVPQVGSVEIQDHVDIGANSCIDRGALGPTRIGLGSKLDNLVQVGHNVRIGQHSILCGQVGIAGSATIGNRVTLGGSSGVGDHVTITDDVRCAGWTGVTHDLTERGDYAGFPAQPARSWRREVATLRRLSLRRKVENSGEE